MESAESRTSSHPSPTAPFETIPPIPESAPSPLAHETWYATAPHLDTVLSDDDNVELEPRAELEGRPVRGNRGKLPAKLEDYYVGYASKFSMDDYLNFDQLSPTDSVYALSLVSQLEPTTYGEAVAFEHWCKPMDEETHA
ncbi:unnamed protein product [Linum trigynum]|uniref:Uncharacterized protein n=1 Tax=Linum trigynum TaxID=586398 RepID=A0AAV2DWH0_9ROSI